MIDTHAHIHDPKFDEDRSEMVARAREAGISEIICVGTDLADSMRALETANLHGFSAAVGIHPHEAEAAPADLDAAFAPLFERKQNARIVAIGEIGLDFYYDHSPHDIQTQVLHAQLALAARHDLPVIFHERNAIEAFVDVLQAQKVRRSEAGAPALRGVVHCFTRDLAAAKLYTQEFDLYLGIGGVLTFKTAQELRDAIAVIGLDRIILETDAPYLAPVPFRGRRNEPAMMLKSAEKLAEITATPLDVVIATTTANAKRLFAL